MATSVLEQYRIADFIEWSEKKRLTLNPHFQRRAVWTIDGQSYLIDTLLRALPMPEIYMRTYIDVASKAAMREVVDGQQRLRAILDFAKGTLRLNRRAGENAGKTYNDLDVELQETFLSRSVAVVQLINASDDEVLEVFARLNSYTVPLNAAENRHATYQGAFKWKVIDVAANLGPFLGKYDMLSIRERLRMLDDQFTAELFGVLLEGIKDGGAKNIDRLYDKYDSDFPEADETADKVIQLTSYIDENFEETLEGSVFSRLPQFLLFFGAIAHIRFGLPEGDLGDDLPPRPQLNAINIARARDNLAALTQAVQERGPSRFQDFVAASSGTTQRIASRRTRFRFIWSALIGEL